LATRALWRSRVETWPQMPDPLGGV
jgi:hypothetical protein